MRNLCVLVAAALVAACSMPVSVERAAAMTDAEICGDYGDLVRDFRRWDAVNWQPGTFATGAPAFAPLVAEIKRRELVSSSAFASFARGEVGDGMTETELLCTLGRPKSVAGNEWIFDTYSGPYRAGERTIEVRDGRVTAIEH